MTAMNMYLFQHLNGITSFMGYLSIASIIGVAMMLLYIGITGEDNSVDTNEERFWSSRNVRFFLVAFLFTTPMYFLLPSSAEYAKMVIVPTLNSDPAFKPYFPDLFPGVASTQDEKDKKFLEALMEFQCDDLKPHSASDATYQAKELANYTACVDKRAELAEQYTNYIATERGKK